MQSLRRGGALLASLSVLALAGCHHDNSSQTKAPELSPGIPVATVNGQTIDTREFYLQMESDRPTTQQVNLPVGQVVLQTMINGLMWDSLAQQLGVAPPDSEVDAIFNTTRLANDASSTKTLDQVLAQTGVTPDDIKNYQLKPQLSELLAIQKIGALKPVTDADVSAFYDKNKAKFTYPERAHIKRIVLTSAADAQRIYSQIQKGQSFDTFVSQSVDRQFAGGDVPIWIGLDAPRPPLVVPPAMFPAIRKAAQSAGNSPADVTPPFAYQNAYWIAEVVATQPKTVLPLDQVKEYIRFLILAGEVRANPSAAQAAQQQLRSFQSTAKISISDPRYSQLLAALTAPPPPAPSLGVPGAPPTSP